MVRVAPLIFRLRAVPSIHTVVCIAAQQGRRLAGELADFGLQADEELAAGRHTSPAQFVDQVIGKHMPDCVLVCGDADKSMLSLNQFPTSGGRSADLCLYELHHRDLGRVDTHLIDLAATRHFVSSESSRDALLNSGVAVEHLYLTDSTEVDAVLMAAERIRGDGKLKASLAADFPFVDSSKRLIFVTGHHCDDREYCLRELCRGLIRLAGRPDVQLVFSLPSDPVKNRCASRIFAGQPAITLIPPQDFLHSVYLMLVASLILSDPDNMPKGALSLNKPVLVMSELSANREAAGGETTEQAGAITGRILQECCRLLDDHSYFQLCSTRRNPYGDGHASQRIVETLLR